MHPPGLHHRNNALFNNACSVDKRGLKTQSNGRISMFPLAIVSLNSPTFFTLMTHFLTPSMNNYFQCFTPFFPRRGPTDKNRLLIRSHNVTSSMTSGFTVPNFLLEETPLFTTFSKPGFILADTKSKTELNNGSAEP